MAIANFVKHRTLLTFSEKLWVNAAPDWLKSAWVDWDSALYKWVTGEFVWRRPFASKNKDRPIAEYAVGLTTNGLHPSRISGQRSDVVLPVAPADRCRFLSLQSTLVAAQCRPDSIA